MHNAYPIISNLMINIVIVIFYASISLFYEMGVITAPTSKGLHGCYKD